jgi:endonuclease YncB( thermonuclease family)
VGPRLVTPGRLYRAAVIDAHDGDTVRLDVDLAQRMRGRDRDLGFSVYVEGGALRLHEQFRLLGINAPELGNPDGSGVAARDYLVSLLTEGYRRVWVRTERAAGHDQQEKYGRWLGTLWLEAEDPSKDPSLNQRMVSSGHAVPFMAPPGA